MTAHFMVFAGTTEGRELVCFMSERGIPATVYTATEYGAQKLSEAGVRNDGCITVRIGRLDKEDILREICKVKPTAVVDATHPFAVEISTNLSECCEEAGAFLLRLGRPEEQPPDEAGIIRVPDAGAAADYLASAGEGMILLTVGIRFLPAFAALPGASRRLVARVLPTEESILACVKCNIPAASIIAAEGPFDMAQNLACIRRFGIKYLVTKETGREGGYYEKIDAAKAAGVTVVSIMRPPGSGGLPMDEVKKKILELCE